ncbi:hypothetical protein [Pelagibacterium halotolerans]|uniref:Uncharacterized protein n=1 Tax=Pelagibacterium halotolerans (strain DSM 22347 / JCM 15775 / CGMCC 1.7692 / B2) TaxID=1082931 RepID=G4R8S6_PELHB|nr:hypothetical protein [Pelagibacterium halotolerans]AEQ50362.1 hypothetical protein KKY_317 [Pelagibacterium halotolerans B2]QJR19660.1 hypothetical protein HKM20_15195 [Pelagibacterium halotolerans]SDZ85424.1 hypothetical protein SAMN05428936_101253 [Pelagibacterium halotolerans]
MKLLLAVDIADRLRDILASRRPFDIESEARSLVERHPEAHVEVDDVVATMMHEIDRGAGRTPPHS